MRIEAPGGGPRVAVKDAIDVAGLPMLGGSPAPARRARPAECDADCVAAVRAAEGRAGSQGARPGPADQVDTRSPAAYGGVVPALDVTEEPVDVDVLVVGAGPVGLFGAFYAGLRGLSTAVMDSLPEVGGQVSAMYPEKAILDVAGFASVKGRDLVDELMAQLEPYPPQWVLGERAEKLSYDGERPVVTGAEGRQVRAGAVVLTGGIGSFTPRPLPAGEGWEGRGLVYFVPRPADHTGKDVVVVGGGDSAVDWAVELHAVASSVTLVHRRDRFRAHASSLARLRALGVPIMTPCTVTALHGEHLLEAVDVQTVGAGVDRLACQTIVAALGFVADIGPLAEWGLHLQGRHVLTDSRGATNLPRVFAAGDMAFYAGKVALIATGFGEVCTAVNNAAVAIDPGAHLFPGHSSEQSA